MSQNQDMEMLGYNSKFWLQSEVQLTTGPLSLLHFIVKPSQLPSILGKVERGGSLKT